ncbi:MAG: hypothetical protein OER82_07870 [Nitrosopumilus sp.]|nr:hypothetical protein [Nitrosopumilus sp.]
MNDDTERIENLIKYTRPALNNEKTVWNKDGVFANCAYLRYMLVLYWVAINPIYVEKCLTIYSLNNAAKQHSLDFDKTKRAKIFYDDFIKRKEITFNTKDNITCYEITKKGMKLCEERLVFLSKIVKDLKDRYESDEEGKFSKGISISGIPKGILHKIQIISREIPN